MPEAAFSDHRLKKPEIARKRRIAPEIAGKRRKSLENAGTRRKVPETSAPENARGILKHFENALNRPLGMPRVEDNNG